MDVARRTDVSTLWTEKTSEALVTPPRTNVREHTGTAAAVAAPAQAWSWQLEHWAGGGGSGGSTNLGFAINWNLGHCKYNLGKCATAWEMENGLGRATSTAWKTGVPEPPGGGGGSAARRVALGAQLLLEVGVQVAVHVELAAEDGQALAARAAGGAVVHDGLPMTKSPPGREDWQGERHFTINLGICTSSMVYVRTKTRRKIKKN